MIYLDNAATTLIKPAAVEEAVVRALHTAGNAGRGAHEPTLEASRILYETRRTLAKLFHAPDPSRIAFAMNASAALNTAIQGSFGPGDHVITTVCEHNSVLRPLYRLREQGLELTIVPADRKGRIDPDDLRKAVRPDTRGIVCAHAGNLTGNIIDLSTVSSIAREYGLLLIVDAAQTAGCYPVDVQKTGIDILCFSGHKGLYGPQGTGGLYVREGVTVRPFMVGGSGIHSFDEKHPSAMPEALEAGTQNAHGLAGLNAGVSFVLEKTPEEIHRKELALARTFLKAVRDWPDITLYGDYDTDERTGIVTLNLAGLEAAEVSEALWERGQICTRAGAHCAPLMHRSLGTEECGAVRFSFSCFNTEEEAVTAAEVLASLRQ